MFQYARTLTSSIRAMLQLAWRMDARLTTVYYLTSALAALSPVAVGIMLNVLIDKLVVPPGTHASLSLVLVVVLAAYYVVVASGNVIGYGLHTDYYDYLFRYELQDELTYRFSEKLASLDVEHLEDPNTQNLIAKVRDTHNWRLPDFFRVFAYAFGNIVTFLAAVIALLPLGWWVVLIVSMVALPRLFLRSRFGALQWSMYGSGAPEARKLWYLQWLFWQPETIREMKVFRSAPALLGRFQDAQKKILELGRAPLRKYRNIGVLIPIAETAIVCALAATQLPAVLNSDMSVGRYVFFVTMLQQAINSAAGFGANLGELYQDSLFVTDYLDLLALPQLITNPEHGVQLPLHPPRIEFADVGFSYPNGQRVLDHVSFVIEPGESVALVGVNGAGKSTIVKLLCRFYDVTSGAILVDGHDIRELDLDNWRQHLGTLFQEFVHYHLSVRDNIMLGEPGVVDEERMIQAARKSGAAGFIEKLVHGYDQMLGNEFEDGAQLSGGQWQKLAIARAFYHSPPVLIMDEPTSAIDAQAEYEIFSNLEKEYREKTLVLVSHRFSTVRNADRILVIENGQVVERGTHDDLLDLEGVYSSMFSVQAAGYR